MKKAVVVFVVFIVCLSTNAQPKVDVAKQIQLSVAQYKNMLATLNGCEYFPQSTSPDGSLRKLKSDWWCSGFFGGSLWYLYEYTKDTALLTAAKAWIKAVEKEQYNTETHDLGFMHYCLYGNEYRLVKDTGYKSVLLNGAASLSTRFNPAAGLIKSWNQLGQYSYPVIIDNMMNLELLFWASKISGNKKYYNISITHADNTLKNRNTNKY